MRGKQSPPEQFPSSSHPKIPARGQHPVLTLFLVSLPTRLAVKELPELAGRCPIKGQTGVFSLAAPCSIGRPLGLRLGFLGRRIRDKVRVKCVGSEMRCDDLSLSFVRLFRPARRHQHRLLFSSSSRDQTLSVVPQFCISAVKKKKKEQRQSGC